MATITRATFRTNSNGALVASRVIVRWPTCDEEDCIGRRLESGKCLTHAADFDREVALQDVSRTGMIHAGGLTISSTLLEQILAAMPRDSDGRRKVALASFELATFQGNIRFKDVVFQETVFIDATFEGEVSLFRVTFQGDTRFAGARFQRKTYFSDVIFSGDTGFENATFEDYTDFTNAKFEASILFQSTNFKDRANFDGATFKGDTGFWETTFGDNAQFNVVSFRGETWFERATFQGSAQFEDATFQCDVLFGSATFQGVTNFAGTIMRRKADFTAASFEHAPQLGPILAFRGLDLNDVHFSEPVTIEVSTPDLRCRWARFSGGVQFRLRWARVVLDDADMSAPSLLFGIPALASDDLTTAERRIAKAWTRLYADSISERPRLLSARRANVAGLGLSNVSLTDCRFAGAHNLDHLRLEGDVTLGLSAARAGWEQRQVIAEESTWRASRPRDRQWTAPQWPDWAGDEPTPLDPDMIAGLYRALRKGREDAKDEPGAADFYYGEMEMRRHANRRAGERESRSRGRVDRAVLSVYWLVSGYGLRAWRAFAAFGVIVAVFALAFHLAGFISPPKPATYWTSLLYAFRSTLSLSDDAVSLTNFGQLLQALLRLTGPVLLGLGLLALRGRVKR